MLKQQQPEREAGINVCHALNSLRVNSKHGQFNFINPQGSVWFGSWLSINFNHDDMQELSWDIAWS